MNDFENSLSTGLIVKYVRLAGLPGGDDSQATFMNKDQYFPNATLDEQIKKYCVMQDVNGLSHLNSPTKILIRIANVDKMTIENDKIIVNENMSVNGNITANTLSVNSTYLNVNYVGLNFNHNRYVQY